MEDIHLSPQTYLFFAELLEYPRAGLVQFAARGVPGLATVIPQAQESLDEFISKVGALSPAQLEETYTRTFDLQGTCYPYVGHHLFGESQKRSLFMARLNQEYWETGFDPDAELPDHLAVILRYLAHSDQGEFNQILIMEGLLPALEKMQKILDENAANPYGKVLQALQTVLITTTPPNQVEPAGAETGGLNHA